MRRGLGQHLYRSTGGGFSPAYLFANGEQGAWFDPSDLTTLFQDSAGTTPVTAVEQPVGLMKDKSGRGNHAFQTTSTSRPTLRARYNLLTRSEDFGNATWSKTTCTVSTDATTSPAGDSTADKLIPDVGVTTYNIIQGSISKSAVATTYTYTIYVKDGGFQSFTLYINDNAATANRVQAGFNISTATTSSVSAAGTFTAASASIRSVGSGWYRCVLTGTSSTETSIQVRLLHGTGTGNGTSGIFVWGAQLLTAADVTATGNAYQRIADAATYDTSNTVFRPYLAFDGSDDSMLTNSVDFSATDKMTVWAGVTKLSDAAGGIITELSADIGVNTGAIVLLSPSSAAGNNIRFGSKGTTLREANVGGVAPITSVLAGIGDIGGDISQLRVNAAVAATNTGDQGTGNYGNYPLYIGRRNNATLPFNGRAYSLIVRGAQSTAAQISSTESWVNQKTGAY